MVKQRDDNHAKILYKKSCTTYSRTCSTISNQYKTNTKQTKKKQSKGFYVEGGKIKRDVRIETDFCIQRRRLIKQLLKMSSADAKSYLTSKTNKSAKSRYSNISINHPVEEFRDDSASGDNEKTSEVLNVSNKMKKKKKKQEEDIMYNQLNLLVKTWVEQFLENKELKNMVQTVFETIMEKEQTMSNIRSSSYTTYVLDQNDNTKSTNITSNYHCGIKRVRSTEVQSSYGLPTCDTVPVIYKTIRLVSTLSIPRNMHKKEIGVLKKKGQKVKVKKGHCKKTLMALIKPTEIQDSDSNLDIDLFEVSTKSWLKRCANFDERNILKKLKMGRPPTGNKSPDKEASNNIKRKQRDMDIVGSIKETKKLRHTRSLVVNIFEKNINMDKKFNNDDTMEAFSVFDRNFTSNEGSLTERITCKRNLKTSRVLNETDESDTLVTIDLLANSLECESTYVLKKVSNNQFTKQVNKNNHQKNTNTLCTKNSKIQKYIVKKPKKSLPKFEDIRHKEFSYLRKKLSKQANEEQEFLSHLQDVFKFFGNYETNRDMKLDIHVNVYPTFEDSPKQSRSETPQDFMTNPTIIYNVAQNLELNRGQKDISNKPKIIPLLDGAVSHAKYLFNEENTVTKAEETVMKKGKERASMTNELGIKEELSEIKTVLMRVSNLVHECVIEKLKDTVALQKLNAPQSETFKRTGHNENFQKCQSVSYKNVASKPSIKFNEGSIAHSPSPYALSRCEACNREIIKYATNIKAQAYQNYKTDSLQNPTQPANRLCQVVSTCHTSKVATQQYVPLRSVLKCPNCQTTFSQNRQPSILSYKTCNAYSQSPTNPILKCPNCRVAFSQDFPSFRKCSVCNSAVSQCPSQARKKTTAKATVAQCTSTSAFTRSVTSKTSDIPQSHHRENVVKYDKHFPALQSSQSSPVPTKPSPYRSSHIQNKRSSPISPTPLKKKAVNTAPISLTISPVGVMKPPTRRIPSVTIPAPIIIPFPDSRSAPPKSTPKETNISTLTKCQSLGIQISNRLRSVNRSGLKLTKAGKKGKEKEKENKKAKTKKKKKNPFKTENVLKNLASYRIIESESVIEVTDMTLSKAKFSSAAATNIALTCSLPQAKSLYEVSCEETKKKLTYISTSQDAGPSKGFCNTLPRDSTKSSCQYTVTAESVNIKPCLPEVMKMESSEMELEVIENTRNLKPSVGSTIIQGSFNSEFIANKNENVKKELKIESSDWVNKTMNNKMKLLKYIQSDVIIAMPRKNLKMAQKKQKKAQQYPDLKSKIAMWKRYLCYTVLFGSIILMVILLNYFYIGDAANTKKVGKTRIASSLSKYKVDLSELGF